MFSSTDNLSTSATLLRMVLTCGPHEYFSASTRLASLAPYCHFQSVTSPICYKIYFIYFSAGEAKEHLLHTHIPSLISSNHSIIFMDIFDTCFKFFIFTSHPAIISGIFDSHVNKPPNSSAQWLTALFKLSSTLLIDNLDALGTLFHLDLLYVRILKFQYSTL